MKAKLYAIYDSVEFETYAGKTRALITEVGDAWQDADLMPQFIAPMLAEGGSDVLRITVDGKRGLVTALVKAAINAETLAELHSVAVEQEFKPEW